MSEHVKTAWVDPLTLTEGMTQEMGETINILGLSADSKGLLATTPFMWGDGHRWFHIHSDEMNEELRETHARLTESCERLTTLGRYHQKYFAADADYTYVESLLGEERMDSYYLCINAGKKALTLNLVDPEGKKILGSVIKELKIDVFVTNQLPKNYEKLGIDYETLKSYKPDIIWLGVTGFGPDSNEAAYDPMLQARSGLMEMTGEVDRSPQVMGIPLPDMGTSEHGYGLIMKALYKRAMTGEGEHIDLVMFESSVSWLTTMITLNKSFGRATTRRGNTHEFFAPVSVYKTRNGFVYIVVGNDRQWKSMVSQESFRSLDRPEYEKNKGRIEDVKNLNGHINEITQKHTSEALIDLFRSITVPISKIQTIPEVVSDPQVQRRLLTARDPVTQTEITMAPPPYMTPFLKHSNRSLSFPPRFGQHNQEIFGQQLGYDAAELLRLKEKGII